MNTNYIKRFLGGFCIAAISCSSLQAQTIDYKVTYNLGTNLYEVYGRATANLTNINLGGSQMGMVFPAAVPDAQLTVVSVIGGDWTDGTPAFAPAAQPGSDFHAISTDGTSTFSMTANVETLLFTISTGGTCFAGARMYIDGADPISTDPGMGGADYSTFLGDPNTLITYTGAPYANGGTICTPLAARLLSFTGQRNGSEVLLNWSVADEREVAAYQLERSRDARNWSAISKRAPYGDHTGVAAYQYTDAGAGQEPLVYYRLQLQNQNGTSSYSDVLRLKLDGKSGKGFTLLPNPVKAGNEVILQHDGHAAGVLSVLSSTGQQLLKTAYSQDELIRISTSGWASGTYFIRWDGSNGERFNSRLSIQ